MRVVLHVKRNIVGVFSQQYNAFIKGVCISDLVKYIWVSSSHISHNQISPAYLIIDSHKYIFAEYLLIYSFAISSSGFASRPNPELVDVKEILAKRHEDKYE